MYLQTTPELVRPINSFHVPDLSMIPSTSRGRDKPSFAASKRLEKEPRGSDAAKEKRKDGENLKLYTAAGWLRSLRAAVSK
jgi:hypothetical protein